MIQAIVIIGFSAFALTFMLQETDGPGDIFLRVRLYLGTELPIYDEEKEIGTLKEGKPSGFLAKLYGCYWCLSTWWCFLLTVGYIFIGYAKLVDILYVWFAAIGVSALVRSLYLREES
jgi:hypothetical protein